MSDLITLRELRLVPVLELEPWAFSSCDRPRPQGSGTEMPEAWGRYWLDCLADSGIAGLAPLRPASWHVSVSELGDRGTLARIVHILTPEVCDVSTPEGVEEVGALAGGLALLKRDEIVVEPTCCSDLGNLSEWRAAKGHQEPEWRMLWIGHPWLSVRAEGRILVLSEPHESDDPKPRWTVDVGVLGRAVDAAEVALEGFARRLEGVLAELGSGEHIGRLARRLAESA